MRRNIFCITVINFFFLINTSAADYFWVGGSGTWSDISHWATTSGGSIRHLQIPTPNDDVYFDTNSFTSSNQTININVPASCRTINWTSVRFNPTLSGNSQIEVYGDLILSRDMIVSFGGDVLFKATSGIRQIRTFGKVFINIKFNGVGSEWRLIDSLKVSRLIQLNNGHFNSNSQYVDCGAFQSPLNANRILTIANSTIECRWAGESPAWLMNGDNLTANTGNSSIIIRYHRGFVHQNRPIAYANLIFERDAGYPEGGYVFTSNGCSYKTISFNEWAGGALSGSQKNKIDSLIINAGMLTNGPKEDTIGVYISRVNGILTGGSIIRKAIFFGNSTINGNNRFDTLEFSPGTANSLQGNGIQTVSSVFKAVGNCRGEIIIESTLYGTQAQIRPTVLPVGLTYLSVKDTRFDITGGVTATNSVDLGNNLGITISARQARNFYWVGGSGNWSDVSRWSFSSGGPSSGCLPSLSDNIFFDAQSFSASGQVVNFNLPLVAFNNMNWLGASNTPTLLSSADVRVYGSVTLISNMNLNLTGNLYFQSTSTNNTITTANKLIQGNIYFNGNGGEWRLQDSLRTSKYIYLVNGHLNSNSRYIGCSNFYSTVTNSRSLTIINSTIEVKNTSSDYTEMNWKVNDQNLQLNALNSQINLSRTNPLLTNYFEHIGVSRYHNLRFYNSTFSGMNAQGLKFNKIEFDSPNSGNISFVQADSLLIRAIMAGTSSLGSDSITYLNSLFPIALSGNNRIGIAIFGSDAKLLGNNSFGTISLNPGSAYTFGAGSTQTLFQNLIAQAGCNNNISLESSESGTRAIIRKTSGIVNVNAANIQDISATGGATFNALNSSDLGNNLGWIFNSNPSRNLYWVGGTGNWNDSTHWSLTSGGAPVNCIPSALDNVFFDTNSFSTIGQSVTLNTGNAICRNMTWTGARFTPTLTGPNGVRIFGSLTLISQMRYTAIGEIVFKATSPGQTITTANLLLTSPVSFSGAGGEWILQDSLKSSKQLSLISGKLNANGKVIQVFQFFSNYTTSRSLVLDNSILRIELGQYIVSGTNFQLGSTGSIIIVNAQDSRNSINFWHTGAPLNYNIVRFISQEARFEMNNCSFSKLIVENNLWSMGGGRNKYDSIIIRGWMEPRMLGFTNDTINSLSVFGDARINLGCRIRKANLYNSATIWGDNTFDTLYFSPGYIYTLGARSVQKINTDLVARGNGCFPIKIQSTLSGVQASFSKSAGTVVCDFLQISDNAATGGATFTAGRNSSNTFNNSGWSFANAPGYSFGLGPDTSFCGPSLLLTTTNFNGGIAFLWQDGSTNSTFTVTQTGIYYVTVTYASNCRLSDTISVINNTPNPAVRPVISLVEATPFTLEFRWTAIPSAQGYLVSINNGAFTAPSSGLQGLSTLVTNLSPNQTINIVVKAVGGSPCFDVLSAVFSGKTTNILELFIPSGFTPNGDGKNDQLKVYGTYKEYSMYIYNQWGALVWSTKQSSGWDGMAGGKKQPSGVYSYVVEAILYDQKKVVKKGTINLIQ
jgi:gliding motility-associated-like protein